MKCRDCKYYLDIDAKMGTCFGVMVEGDRDTKDSPQCQGRYFEPSISPK